MITTKPTHKPRVWGPAVKAWRATLVAVAVVGFGWNLGLLAAPASSGNKTTKEWYRYTNERGVVVLDQSIPPQYIDSGYSVLSTDGRVIRVIPSKAERERLEQERIANERRNKVIAEQEANDQDLMRMYSSPDDVERARDRRLSSIDAAISLALSNLERARREKVALETEGARIERSGKRVPQKMVDNLAAIETQIRQRSAEIQTRRNEKERVRAAYQRDILRVKELYGYSDSAAP